jgi:cell division protein FtsB|tara:strand:- start:90 stop:299 length:210 start_codon:yes stop_codon:yes gene_type:complete
MNAQIVISTLQKKISELTLINVMMEAQISDLQSQLNSMNNDQQQSENALDGNENQAKEIDNSSDSPDNF